MARTYREYKATDPMTRERIAHFMAKWDTTPRDKWPMNVRMLDHLFHNRPDEVAQTPTVDEIESY